MSLKRFKLTERYSFIHEATIKSIETELSSRRTACPKLNKDLEQKGNKALSVETYEDSIKVEQSTCHIHNKPEPFFCIFTELFDNDPIYVKHLKDKEATTYEGCS